MKKNQYLCTRFANIYPYYNKKFINFMEKIFTLLRGKQLMFFIMTALLMGAVETAKADYSITGPEILSSSDWEKQSGRWNEWNGGIYDYAGGNYLSDTELISPLMTITKAGQSVIINGNNNGGSTSVLKVYYSTDKSNWTLAKDLSDDVNATTGTAIDMGASFEVEGNYYVKLVCNKVYIVKFTVEEYDVVYTPEMTVYSDNYGTVATSGKTTDFGLVTTAPSYTYYVKNTKRGTLYVEAEANGGYSVNPTKFALEAGQQQEVTVTAPAKGAPAGTLTITGKNGDEVLSTFTANFKGVIKDSEHFFVDFEDGKMPEGWITDGWTANNTASGTANNKGWAGPTNTDVEVRLISPMVMVEEGEPLVFCAFPRYRNSGSLKIEYRDKEADEWTVVKAFSYSDFADGKWSTISVYGIPAGKHQIALNDQEIYITDIYGFKLAPETEALVLDETVAPEALEKGVQDVELKYNVKDGWNTIALPFAVTDLSVFGEGAKAYELTGYNDGALNFKAAETLKAGSPYVLYVETAAEANVNFKFKGVDITATEPATVGFNDAKFVATYAPMAAGTMTGKYGVVPSTGKIQKGSANASMKGFRAYFELPAGANGARMIIDGEDVTAISSIITDAENGNAIYNLNGQRVKAATKGVYIINGKKMIIK